jgi:hypothetical protein
MLPRTGDPIIAAGCLIKIVAELIERPQLRSFAFGRAADLAAARTRLDCNDLFVLYASEDERQTGQVEECLDQAFIRHARFDHRQKQTDLQTAGVARYVFVALWKSAESADSTATPQPK